ncbi:pantoate--beta-alanine ligase [Fodinicola feengrottensis]|uniref:pantoate--beta-alanine ligase n=1 Tax=Fodinicola feengrottensis TaxID=435914 RepID=UPI0028BF1AEF|nr:pantoate--beta-alanine ligase [Fodinicola feengrottensis]
MTGQIGAPAERLLTPPVVRDRDALAAARDRLPGPVAVVMTMGALHAGHAALLRQARARAASVIATIFVNPLQFAPTEDLDRYPRTLKADLEICVREQVDLVFAPTAAVMYPAGPPQVRVQPGPRGEILEGAFRPGFFGGVLTVVSKLLHLTAPDVTFFGEKDYQQLMMVRQLVTDLSMDIEVVGVPIVREPDGLALSSRNAYLSPRERRSGLALSAALRAGVAASGQGPVAVLAAATAVLAAESTVDVDYCELTDPSLGPPPAKGPARLLIAAKVGATRLIDNTPR